MTTRRQQQQQQQQQQQGRGGFRGSYGGATAGLMVIVIVIVTSSVLAAFRASTTTTTTTALYDYYFYYDSSTTNGPATVTTTEAHRNLRRIRPTTSSGLLTSNKNGTTTTTTTLLTLVEDHDGAPGASASDSDSSTHKNGITMMMSLSKAVGSSIDSRADNNSDNSIERTATSIRQWGCNLHTAPFVFVHIGKAGGGVVRRRFAYAAVNVTRRPNNWYDGSKDRHYYPIVMNDDSSNRRRGDGNSTTTRRRRVTGRAVFCSSGRRRHLPGPKRWSMEGYSQPCSAQTVLGHILACPEVFDGGCIRSDKSYHPLRRDSAHLVYVGHNFVGTELHWLPIPVLKKWWNTYWSKSSSNTTDNTDPVLDAIDNLDGKRPWCDGRPRLLRVDDDSDDSRNERELESQWNCSQTNLEPMVDRWARQTILNRVVAGSSITTDTSTIELTPQEWGRAYGQLYATVPVTRVTLLREPWSWLHSKYAWHEVGTVHNMRCDDIVTATTQLDDAQQPTELAMEPKVMIDSTSSPTPAPARAPPSKDASDHMYSNLQNQERPGWLRLYALKYILFLCGEDCYVRLEMGTATLEEIEAQAAYNLRHSFAVVGLLHEQDQFLEMVHARVNYMDLHQPYTDIPSGGEHKSGKEDDEFCADRFRDPTFQQQVLDAAPEMRALL